MPSWVRLLLLCVLYLLLWRGEAAAAASATQWTNDTLIVSRLTDCAWGTAASPSPASNCTHTLPFFETGTGNVIADACRAQLALLAGAGGVSACVIPSRSINASFAFNASVSGEDVLAMLPHDDILRVAVMRGEDVMLMLEHAVSQATTDEPTGTPTAAAMAGSERFLHMSGLRFVWNPLAPAYARVSHVLVQADWPSSSTYHPLEMAREYRLGATEHMGTGADGFGLVFSAGRAFLQQAGPRVPAEDALYAYLASMATAGCDGGSICNFLEAPPDTGSRVIRNRFLWPPTISAINPAYASANESSVLTIIGSNLGLVPVYYDASSSAGSGAGGVRSPIGHPVPDVVVTVGSNPCRDASVAQIRVQDGSTRSNVSYPGGFNMLASVSVLTCVQDGNGGVEGAVRVRVDTLVQGTYFNYSTDLAGTLGGIRSSRLDAPPLFNYTTTPPCLPDRSYLNAAGVCTCRAGWVVAQTAQGAKVCSKCPAGYYSDTDDAYQCLPCAAGASSREGDVRCELCPENRWNNATASPTCFACPSDSTTLQMRGATRCFCNTGFEEVRAANTSLTLPLQCRPCPEGAECRSELGVARARPGWWFDAEGTRRYYPCPSNLCCDRHDGAGCLPSDPQRCYPHREGFMCGECVKGYSSISGRDCVECPGPNPIVLAALVVVALLFLSLCLLENPSEDASTKLIVDYLQMCFLVLNPTIGINQILALVNLGFGSATSQFNACVMPMPPLLGISATAFIPLALFLLLGLIHLLHWTFAHYGFPRARREGWLGFYERHRWRYTNAAWQVVLFGFMALVSACVQVLDCVHVGARYVVALAPSVECFTGDGHFISAVVALALFCVLTFVVPIWLVSMLSDLSKSTQRRTSAFLHSMKQIKQLKKEYKRQKRIAVAKAAKEAAATAAASADADADADGLDDSDGRPASDSLDQKIMDLDEYLQRQLQPTKRVRRTGHELVLWCYNQDQYWCEAAFLLRRVLFTLVTVLLVREKAAMVVAWGCLVCLVVHARFPVFRKRSSSYYHDVCIGAIAFQCVLNIDIYAQDPTGHVGFGRISQRAQVVIVYAVTILPIVVGVALFAKEFLKERVRKKHAEKEHEDEDEDGLPPPSDSEDEEEEEDVLPDEVSGATAENSFTGSPGFGGGGAGGFSPGFSPGFGPASAGLHHRSSRIVASHSPGGGGLSLASELASGVMAQGPNVSIRSYTNAPIDLDTVLASAHGGIISSPQFPNNNHPPVTIHF